MQEKRVLYPQCHFLLIFSNRPGSKIQLFTKILIFEIIQMETVDPGFTEMFLPCYIILFSQKHTLQSTKLALLSMFWSEFVP